MLFQPRPVEVLVIVPREETDDVLYSLGSAIQLQDFKFPHLRKLYPEKVKIVELLSKLEAFAEQLDAKGGLNEPVPAPVEESEKIIDTIESDIERLNNEERDHLYRERKLEAMLGLLDESEFIGLGTLLSKSLEEWETFQSTLQTQGIRLIASHDYEHEKIALIKGAMEGYMGDERRIREAVSADLAALHTEGETLAKKKADLTQKHGPRINTLVKQLDSEIGLLDEKRLIAHSELFSFIKGIVEHKDVGTVSKRGLVLAQPKAGTKGFGDNYMKVISNALSRTYV